MIASEPQRFVYPTLCGKVALDGLTNVTCFLAAEGEKRAQDAFPTVDPRQAFNFGAVRPAGDG